jgi:hypothetical protein
MFVPMATPFLNHLLFYRGLSYLGTLAPDWFSLFHYGQHWIRVG